MHKINQNNDFIMNTTTLAFAAADVEHACAAPCLRAEECTRMRCGAVRNGRGQWRRREELLNKVVIFVFGAQNKYSRSFVKLRFNHWCPMDYFPRNISVTFLSMQGQKALRFHQNIYRVLAWNSRWRSLIGLTQSDLMTSLPHGTADWFSPVSVANELLLNIQIYD